MSAATIYMIRQYKALLTATFIRCCTQHVYFSFVTTIRRTAKCKPCRDIVNKLVPEVVLYVPRLQTASTQRSCLHISTLCYPAPFLADQSRRYILHTTWHLCTNSCIPV